MRSSDLGGVFLVLCLILASRVVVSSPSSGGFIGSHQIGYIPINSECRGSVSECLLGDGSEFDLDSELSRRVLAWTRYISYGALSRNSVPCSRRGASYYNCRPGAQANPYRRGCSAITRCRG